MGNRIYYAIEQIGIKAASIGPGGSFTLLHGIQSVGLNTNFSLTPVDDWGTIPVYSVLEDSFNIGLSIKKYLDGYPPIYMVATSGAISPLLENTLLTQCSVGLSIFSDSSVFNAIGTPVNVLQCTGMRITSLKYIFDVNGPFSEEISFEGNHKLWTQDWNVVNTNDISVQNQTSFDGQYTGLNSPLYNNGRVARRQDFKIGGGVDGTRLPLSIPSGSHLQNVTVTATVGRDNHNSFGSKIPTVFLPNFPIEVTTEITINATSGDYISTTESGILTVGPPCKNFGNTTVETISVATTEGLRLYCGSNNKLASVSYNGGDTSGGHVRISYTYKGYNDLTILHSSINNADWQNRSNILTQDLVLTNFEPNADNTFVNNSMVEIH